VAVATVAASTPAVEVVRLVAFDEETHRLYVHLLSTQ
jgi:hypothetical protein